MYHEETKKLHLIDYDEARISEIEVRVPDKLNGFHMRRYAPNLMNDPFLYTKNQLINLFCECWDVFLKDKVSDEENESNLHTLTDFVKRYEEAFPSKKKCKEESIDPEVTTIVSAQQHAANFFLMNWKISNW